MKDLVIRPAVVMDIPHLMKLYTEFHEYYVDMVPLQLRSLVKPTYSVDAALENTLRRILADPDAIVLVADNRGQLVGLSEVYLREDSLPGDGRNYPYAYMQSLVVAAPSRSQGVGMLLVDAAEEWARSHGCQEMRLEPAEYVEGLLNFYERLGYRTVRRTMAHEL
jgi:GNAT superfamily N-acetyltransferase